ncbi:hypothetical protein RQP46_004857 [Phenoliferia psychrophenolica]
MALAARKSKDKSSPGSGFAPSAGLPTSLAALLSQLSLVATALSSGEVEPAALLLGLKPAQDALQSFEGALQGVPSQTAVANVLPRAWQEDLDREGVSLWNRSTALRYSAGSQGSADREDGKDRKLTIAALRKLAFELISLGTPQPLTPTTHLSLLSLATKAALAASSANDLTSTNSLLSTAASHAESVSVPQNAAGSPTSDEAKALVAFYSARARASIRAGNAPIATWMMSKLKGLKRFKNAALSVPLGDNNGTLLIAELHQISEDRRALRLAILQEFAKAIAERLSISPTSATAQVAPLSSGDAHHFAGQIVMAATFLALDRDRARLESLFDTLGNAGLKLDASSAFVVTTFIWKAGDQLTVDKNFVESAAWYVLGAHLVLQGAERTIWPKSLRKAALSLIEVGEYDQAEAVMRRGMEAGAGSFAKSHFLRFYNFVLMKDEVRASGALKSMVECPDFTIELLLWASKSASESGSSTLLARILGQILDVCTLNPRNLDQVDLLVLLRFEASSLLAGHFKSALTVATSLAGQDTPPPTLRKSIAWLSKTGYNLCIKFQSEWDPKVLCGIYSTIADLMDLEIKLHAQPDPETLSRLWLCRFAGLLVQVLSARHVEIKAYHELLSPVRDLRDALLDALQRHPALPRADEIEASLISLELEVLIGVEDWASVSDAVKSFQSSERVLPAKIIKSAAEAATANSSCPPDITFVILKTTLDVLAGKSEYTPHSLAGWFRVVISWLLKAGASAEALKYVHNARDFLKVRRVRQFIIPSTHT